MREPTLESLRPLPTAVFRILIALADRDRHGYSIMQDVSARRGGGVRLSAGTLYSSIRRMLEQGLVEELAHSPDPSSSDERRRYYRLTRFGRRAAAAEVKRLKALVRQARATRAGVGCMSRAIQSYRILLHCYPAAFREEYGNQMRLIFAEQLGEARRSGAVPAEVALWAQAAFDALTVAPKEHWHVILQDLRYALRTTAATPALR
jgi:DNA-binding PadR family transcriptional regulator